MEKIVRYSSIILQLCTLVFTSFATIDKGENHPLLLTPLIESNKLNKAKNAAKISYPAWMNLTSYSGLITVDKEFDSNMFFWFVPSENNYKTAPLLIWLQGGPGISGLFALFNLNGPLTLDPDMNVVFREYSWTKKYSMIYVDNPVGTGFSSTKGGYAENETLVGEHLYSFLTQFLTVFTELQKNDFYIVGESYGSKFGAALGKHIHKNRNLSKVRINLKGFIIESGTFDPVNQAQHSEYLYQLGLIDEEIKHIFKAKDDKVVQAIKSGSYKHAFDEFNPILRGYFGAATLFKNFTGLDTFFNILTPNYYQSKVKYAFESYVNQSDVRKALHVGNAKFGGSDTIVKYLLEDILKSARPWLEELLENYRMIFYNGQLDVYAAFPLTEAILVNLKFNTSNEYKMAERKIWYVENEVAGYIKSGGNLAGVLVRNAGHLVSEDQPRNVYCLIDKFIESKI